MTAHCDEVLVVGHLFLPGRMQARKVLCRKIAPVEESPGFQVMRGTYVTGHGLERRELTRGGCLSVWKVVQDARGFLNVDVRKSD